MTPNSGLNLESMARKIMIQSERFEVQNRPDAVSPLGFNIEVLSEIHELYAMIRGTLNPVQPLPIITQTQAQAPTPGPAPATHSAPILSQAPPKPMIFRSDRPEYQPALKDKTVMEALLALKARAQVNRTGFSQSSVPKVHLQPKPRTFR